MRALGAATTLVEAPVDLAVLTQAADADAPWCDPEHADLWLRLGTPHLAATAAGRSGDISPVVEPGRTGCLRCRELARIDADPSWPALAVGLRRRPGGAVPVALSAPLAAVTAQLALARAVSYVDGAAGPATARGLLVRLPGTDVTTYPLAPHPACGCRWGRGLVTMGRMSDLPRRALTRGAKLAALPLGYAGRTAVGLGKRVGGAPAEAVTAEIASVPPPSCSRPWASSRAAR